MSVFTYVMGRIDYAHRNGYIPYVDIDNGQGTSMFGRYFKQKTSITREEVYQSKNVLLSGWDSKPVFPGWCNWINTDFNGQKKELFDQHITFTDEVLDAVQREGERIKPEQCLGLYLRGTDYTSLKPLGHPIQPALEDVRDKIDEILEKRRLTKIYLVTEDRQVYEQVARAYPGLVVTVREDRFWDEYDRDKLIHETIQKHGSIEENNVLYLTKIILLSQCDAFVGGRTNGSVVANALNGGKYEEKFVYDVGYYT